MLPPHPDPPRVRAWQLLTGEDFRHIDRERTVVMVTCSPLEVHGPHLPVVADMLESDAIGLEVMARLTERRDDIDFLHLPPIYVASDVLPMSGSVMFRPSTIQRVLRDLGRSLCAQGFRDIWVSSFHGGPRHFVAIESACHHVNRRHGGRMVSAFSLLLSELTGGQSDLSEVFAHIPGIQREALRGDTHAGAVETSMLLHILGGEHVRPFAGLERRTVATEAARRRGASAQETAVRPGLLELIGGFRHKLKYFERYTYAGAPAAASAEAGEAMLETLAERTADALETVWTGARPLDACHSPLWPARWLFTLEPLSWLFERLMRHRTEVF